MPPFPDVRPLIVNLLARYIIQCKLDGYHGLPGQKSQQDWAHLLEVLCSTMNQPSKISYSSLQFIRYVSLLEKVQKIRMGKLNEHILTDIYKIFVKFSKSPELSSSVIADKLASLLGDMQAGLTSAEVAKFCTKVCSFVQSAMEWYATLPLVNITEDAIVAMDVTPSSSKTVSDETTGSQQRGKKTARQKQATATSSELKTKVSLEGQQTRAKSKTRKAHKPSSQSAEEVHSDGAEQVHTSPLTSNADSRDIQLLAKEAGVALVAHKPSSKSAEGEQVHTSPLASSAGSSHVQPSAKEGGVALVVAHKPSSKPAIVVHSNSSAESSSSSVGPAVIKPSSLKQQAPPSNSNTEATIQPSSTTSSPRHSVKVTKPPSLKHHAPKSSKNTPSGFENVKPNATGNLRSSGTKSSSAMEQLIPPSGNSNLEESHPGAVTIHSDIVVNPGTRSSVKITKPSPSTKPQAPKPTSKVVAQVRPSTASNAGSSSTGPIRLPRSRSSSLKQRPPLSSSESSPNVSVKVEPTSPQKTGGSVISVRPTVTFANPLNSSSGERELNFSVKVEPDALANALTNVSGSSGILQPSVKFSSLNPHASPPSGSNVLNSQNVVVKLEPNVSSSASNVMLTVKLEPSADGSSSQISSVKVEPVMSRQSNASPLHPGASNSSSSPGPSHRHTTMQPSTSTEVSARSSENYSSLLLQNSKNQNTSHCNSNTLPPTSSLSAPSSSVALPPSSPRVGSSPKAAAIQRTRVKKEPYAAPTHKRKRHSPPPLIYMSLVSSDRPHTKDASDSSGGTKVLPFANRGSSGEEDGAVTTAGGGKASGRGSNLASREEGSVGSSSCEDTGARQKKQCQEGMPSISTRDNSAGTINCNGGASASGRGVADTGSGSGEDSAKVETENNESTINPEKNKTRKFGIFDLESFYSKEMEWSSDESDSISSSSPKKLKLSSLAAEEDKASGSPLKPGVRRGMWSDEEVQCLNEGVEIYGEGKWKEIRDAYSVLGCRTTGQLKDKYRNLKGRPQQKPPAIKEQHVNKRKTRTLF